jgi:hypothetical protein
VPAGIKNAESCLHLYFRQINCEVKSYLSSINALMHDLQERVVLCCGGATTLPARPLAKQNVTTGPAPD